MAKRRRTNVLTGTHSSMRVGWCAQGHPSVRGAPAPHSMSQVTLTNDQMDLLHSQALDIFTVMSNAGHSFSDCLAAILLTGINWGSSAQKDR